MNMNQIVFRIAIIILFIEAFIMMTLNLLPIVLAPLVEVLLDSLILATLSTPIIYFFVIKPFIVLTDRAREEICYLEDNDALTKLPNQKQFLGWLAHDIKLVSSKNHKMAILLIDMNRFKDINDIFGHTTFEYIIVQVAKRLKKCSSESTNTLSRVGPDQFAVSLGNIKSNDEAYSIAQRILSQVRHSINYFEHSFIIDPSIGISMYPKDTTKSDELLDYAKTAARYAKNLEEEKISFYTFSQTQKAQRYFRMEKDLRRAVENNEFFLLYQPKVDARTHKIQGVEALIRWKHPEQGLVLPGEFIPLAEETGLIIPIGEWVFMEALAQAKRWLNEGREPIVISINLSGRQLILEQVENIIETIRLSQVPTEYIEFEITETYLMSDVHKSQLLLEKLRMSGASISVDDFGTGYSSLGYLKRFKVDILKIDKVLIQEIESDINDFEIVNAIIKMGHALGLKILAEGVETETQLKMLQKAGCDYFQGYYFSEPVDAEAVFSGAEYIHV